MHKHAHTSTARITLCTGNSKFDEVIPRSQVSARVRPRSDSCAVGPNGSESCIEIQEKYAVGAVTKVTQVKEGQADKINPIQAAQLVIRLLSSLLQCPPHSLLISPPVPPQSHYVISAARMSCNGEDARSMVQCLCRWHRILQSPILVSQNGNFDLIKTSVYESPHPYPDNSDVTHKISCPGAVRMEVSFDPRSQTVSDICMCVCLKDKWTCIVCSRLYVCIYIYIYTCILHGVIGCIVRFVVK